MIPDFIKDKRPQISRICRKYGVRKLWLVGSMARGDTKKRSDIDFLAQYGKRTKAWGMFSGNPLVRPLTELFNRKVDVIPLGALKLRPHWHIKVMKEAEVYYVARKRRANNNGHSRRSESNVKSNGRIKKT